LVNKKARVELIRYLQLPMLINTPLKLLIAYGDLPSSEILQNIFRAHEGFVVIGAPDNAAGLQQMITSLRPDVIVADISLPGMEGFAALQNLMARCLEAKLIISWRYRDEDMVIAALPAECAGYIVEDASPAEYIVAARQVMKGKEYLCSQTERLKSPKEVHHEIFLTIAYCMWNGYNSKDMATATGLTKETISSYRSLFKKYLGSTSHVAVVNYMRKKGLISDE
jgi:DNA-binding NarL/FixJ family response regulator